MKVDVDVVRHVASLARLHVPEERLGVLARELTAILDYADQLAGIDAGGLIDEGALPRRADVPAPWPAPLLDGEVPLPTVVGATGPEEPA